MKLSLAQLRKLPMPYHFEETIDLSETLNGLEDIVETKECEVKGSLTELGIDTYLLRFNSKIELIVQDSVSLELVPYVVESEAEEVYTTDDSYSDATIITNQTLDITEAVVTSILVTKPVVYTTHEFENDEECIEEEEEEQINPAFASLKDLL